MSNLKPYQLITLGVGVGIGFVSGSIFGISLYPSSYRVIPNQEQVQIGYIAPSNLEIQCQDLDGNGEKETIIRIGDKSYLLREVDGEPVISAYEIKPVEVVPKE